MEIRIARSDAEIAECFPVMQELRPHLARESFLSRVRSQAQHGYVLASLRVHSRTVAVAGFRIMENLAWGRFLYVDDLVTAREARSGGYGNAFVSWLAEYARREHCGELHLDSGTQRVDAHRFYRRQGMEVSSYHFRLRLDLPETAG